MALTVQQIQPVAHLSLVLGVLRYTASGVATVIDRLIPPRAMAQTAAHLVERVIPRVPTRQ